MKWICVFLLLVHQSSSQQVAMCNPGSYATSATAQTCSTCAAGTFSRFAGSTVCQSCPRYTGSIAGSSACVACSTSTSCKTASNRVCSSCTVSCTTCVAGTYNDGSVYQCIGCPAGKYSILNGSTSIDGCSTCGIGTTTYPKDIGLTACRSCTSLNQTRPINAEDPDSILDPLVCSWSCKTGYLRTNYSETTFNASKFPTYTYAQALGIFHVQNDYCCNPTLALTGTYLNGCSRIVEGNTTACKSMANAYYYNDGAPKINRCSDWACANDNYYSNGSACLAQPTCLTNYTHRRDSLGALIGNRTYRYDSDNDLITIYTSAFTCVPCSRCIDGSQTWTPCTSAVDTICALCSSTTFSLNGSACMNPVPYGFLPVIVQLTSMPSFQGRPIYYYDGSPLVWENLAISTTGFFINTYASCQPLAASYYSYAGGDAPCSRKDTVATCKTQICNIQCRPWNGTAGWFQLKTTGQCSPCVYDPACASTQYSDMASCGGSSGPVCRDCPAIPPVPNSMGWINPQRPIAGPVPCDYNCRDGYIKTNGTCIFCPNVPANAKITSGCNWVCSLGFIQQGSNQCVPCSNVPTQCGIGAYVGYAPGNQCAQCLPCTNKVDNSLYISAGAFNGPNTCGVQCVPGMFVDPDYGLDVFGNPVSCRPCSAPTCVASYLVACTPTNDAQCVPCDSCGPGQRTVRACSPGGNTQCAPCARPPSPNASWTVGCSLWSCDAGFYLNASSLCELCKQPSACRKSDRFDYVAAGSTCGFCTPCNASLLLPGQCFNGDGQCGATYRGCGFTTTTTVFVIPTTTTVTTTPSPTTTTPPPTSPVPVQLYAALLTLSLPDNSTLNLTALVRCNCEVRLLARSGRRLLDVIYEIVLLSTDADSVANPTVTVPYLDLTGAHPIPDTSVLGDNTRLALYVKTSETAVRAQRGPVWLAGAAAAVVLLILVILTSMAVAGVPEERADGNQFRGVRIERVNEN